MLQIFVTISGIIFLERKYISLQRENEPNLARCTIQFSESCLPHEDRGRLKIEREDSSK